MPTSESQPVVGKPARGQTTFSGATEDEPASITCPSCGQVCDSIDRYCRWCGLALHEMVPEASAPAVPTDDAIHVMETLPPGTRLGTQGRYHIVSTLGKGGFGQAYLADDTRLNRYCVIKRQVLKASWSKKVRANVEKNFEREAHLLVSLNSPGHPNIPEIYEYLPESRCLVMKYIEGRDLEQVLEDCERRDESLSETEALTYIRDACSALVYMHGRDQVVLHRDIKPANILIDKSERIWIVDFGLSKTAQVNVDANQKDTDDEASARAEQGRREKGDAKTQIAGTLGYAPPEQWRGITTPYSDVYALAATLHTLLTGYRPKFTNKDVPHIIRGRKGAFPPAREIKPELSKEVEQLIQRGMSFDMSQRPDAQAFLDALDELLTPAALRLDIQTPDGQTVSNEQELGAWCEQNWRTATTWLYEGGMPSQIKRIWGQNQLADQLGEVVHSYVRDQDSGLDAALALIDPDGFGAHKPRLGVDKQSLDFGGLPATGRRDHQLTLKNTGRRYIRAQMRLPDWLTSSVPVVTLLGGQQITTTLTARARRVPGGGKVRDTLLLHDDRHMLRRIPVQVKVSRLQTLGKWLTGGTRAGVWRLVRHFDVHGGKVWAVAFSPDRHLLASGSADGVVRLWRVSDGKLMQTLKGHDDDVISLAFSPDGRMLISGGADGLVVVWHAEDGTIFKRLTGHSRTVWGVAFSLDGRMLASGSGEINLWDAEDYTLLRTMNVQSGSALSVTFSPDGQVLASGDGANFIKLWRTHDGKLLQTIRDQKHYLSIHCVAFSPDGQVLASAAGSGTIKLWNSATGEQLETLPGNGGPIYSLAFSPDGETLAATSGDGRVVIRRTDEEIPILQMLEGHRDAVRDITFSFDGEMLAACSLDTTVSLWQVD